MKIDCELAGHAGVRYSAHAVTYGNNVVLAINGGWYYGWHSARGPHYFVLFYERFASLDGVCRYLDMLHAAG